MNLIKRLARNSDVDAAVGIGILTKCWQIPAGVVTMVLVFVFFSPETQGVYYTVLGILGLQSMAEAGLQSVILHAASHEWSKLSLDPEGRLTGDRRSLSRIAALARSGTKWFAICAVVFAVTAIAWGLLLFASQSPTDALIPLMLAVCFSGVSLIAGGLVATLEGCNQVETVNRNRLLQAISGSIVVWIVIACGGGLWAIPASFAAQLLWEAYLIFGRYRPMMMQLRQTPPQDLDWFSEVWPLQWKIGLQGFVRQFAFVPILPILYAWQGPIVAGQAGMTMSVLNSLSGAAFAWIRTRAPRLGELIARGNAAARDELFKRTTVNSTIVLVFAVISFSGLIYALQISHVEIAAKISERFLPAFDTWWFAMAIVPQHLVQCIAIFIRAHKQDPLWKITIAGNAILAVLVLVGGVYFGAYAIGGSQLFVFGAITLPCALRILIRFRSELSPS